MRSCADIYKVAHLLRAAGPTIDGGALDGYDAMLERSLSRCLGGALDNLSLDQASLGVTEGGLGLRRAAATAMPAFVASRIEARWIVDLLVGDLVAQDFGFDADDLVLAYDAETDAARVSFLGTLSAAAAERADVAVREAAERSNTPEAALRWRSARRQESCLTGDSLVLPASAEDSEFEPSGLQAALCAIADDEATVDLLGQLDTPELQHRRRRLIELRDRSVSHEWLWRVSPAHGPVVPRGAFVDAVRLRLCAPCVDSSVACARCGANLGGSCGHALRCALPEATRGHYAVRDEALALAHLADPSTSVETVGLIPSAPALRPADIFTSAAIPGRLAALDIGVTSPDAAGAGDDCCEAMFRRKIADYAPHFAELAEQDIVYKPLVWSTFGRAHPETDSVMRSLAVVAARRRGLRDHALILRRARAAIGVRLVTRAVRMLWACIPRVAAEEEQLLFGGAAVEDEAPQQRSVRLTHGDAHVPVRR